MPKRKVISLPMLCVIARKAIEADPLIDNAEWIEQIKCTIVRDGYDYPTGETLASALLRVERALEKQWGPRPPPAPSSTPAARTTPDGSPWRIPRDPTPEPAPFAPALGAPGALVNALQRYAPETLAAIKRAARSPEVKAAIVRARTK